MKTIIKYLLFLSIFVFFISCTKENEDVQPSNSYFAGENELLIVITGLNNNNGEIILELKDEAGNFIELFTGEITDKECVISIIDLEEGEYGFKYFHDENSNDELDTNILGIPKEGYGFSNNVSGAFGPPKFKDTVFDYNGSLTMTCKIIYIL